MSRNLTPIPVILVALRSHDNGEVNTPESKALVLENCSECDVKYKLFYIANKEPPLRHSSKGVQHECFVLVKFLM